MVEVFLEYAKRGAMTVEDLAAVLKWRPQHVRNKSGPGKMIPRMPGYPIRFDPMKMIDVFCQPSKAEKPRSLTIERHKTGAKPIGGYRKCLY